MGKLKIKYKNKWQVYLINTEVESHVFMQTIENVLKHFPKDAPVEFKELF